MNGLIIQPPYFSLRGSHNNRITQGAHYLLETIVANGHTCKLLNMDAKDTKYGSRYNIYKNTYKTIDDEFYGYDFTFMRKHINDSMDFIIICCGDVVVPTVDFGSFKHAEYIAKFINKLNFNIRLIAYGPFVEESNIFDTIICGDAEHKIDDIINLQSMIRIKTENNQLDKLPFLTINNMITPINPIDLDCISASRGCLCNCAFCICGLLYNQKMRYRTPLSFVNEIYFRYHTYGITNFYFTDLLFTSKSDYVTMICDKLIELQSTTNMNINWRCESRIDTINKYTLQKMKDAGCEYIKLGVESMNNDRLKYFNKNITTDQIKETINIIHDVGIKTVVYILLGGFGFSDDDYKKELKEFYNLTADKYTVSLLNPFKGTSIYNDPQWIYKTGDNISHLDHNLINAWGLNASTVDDFFNIESKHNREDDKIRTFNV